MVIGGGDARALSEVSQEIMATLNFFKQRARAYLVDSGTTSTTWYRKYSDGWVEQGGTMAEVGFYKQQTIVYPVPFRDDKYALSTEMSKITNNESQYFVLLVKTRDKTSFHVTNNSAENLPASWFACGYS